MTELDQEIQRLESLTADFYNELAAQAEQFESPDGDVHADRIKALTIAVHIFANIARDRFIDLFEPDQDDLHALDRIITAMTNVQRAALEQQEAERDAAARTIH